ncbi:MAG: serine O-acetyltransferase [Nitrincola lacisaponensis]|uniref:serine O-acetyltransferase n=1 Tax=Nitrincola lacisaponensis TaxID=267850 RepID=UPI003919CA3D
MPDISPPVFDGSFNMNPDDVSFLDLIKEDYRTNDSSVFSQGFLALFCHRFGNWRMSFNKKIIRAPLTLLYLFLRKFCQVFCGIQLDYTVKVGRRVKIEHFGGIVLNARSIGNDVIIRQNTTFGIKTVKDTNGRPVIGNRVDIGVGAVIVGNITIGDDVIIGANSVVSFDVPAGSVVRMPRADVMPRADGPSQEASNAE